MYVAACAGAGAAAVTTLSPEQRWWDSSSQTGVQAAWPHALLWMY